MKVEGGESIRNSQFGISNHDAGSESPHNSPLSSFLFPLLASQSIISKKSKLNDITYEFAIDNKQLAKSALPGQFLHIKSSTEHILRRPISISDIIGDQVCFVIEVRGDGTKHICEKNVDEFFDVLGPLGKGFSLPEGDIVLVGGGIGVAPLLYPARSLKGRATPVLGFRDKSKIILADKFNTVCNNVIVTTDDGSNGLGGTVIDPLKKLLNESNYSAVLACGPSPMMAAVARLCQEHGLPCQVSLEEQMACGVGACYVCACRTMLEGVETMSRVCIDGPVFDANEVMFD